MKDIEKYKKHKEIAEKLKDSLDNKYYYQSIFLEYSYIEDRLNAVVAITDNKLYDKNGNVKKLTNKISVIKQINDNYVRERLSDDLFEDIITWKKKRDKLVHNLLQSENDEEQLKVIAEDGYKLIRKIDNKTKQIINRYKKLYADRIYYQLKNDCYIRSFGDFGYIKSTGIFNDLLFDKSGKLFLSALTRRPQTLDKLSEKIASKFLDVSKDDIKDDVRDFYDMLVEDGFVVKGNNISDVYKSNVGFRYKDIEKVTLKEDYTPKNIRSDIDIQEELDKFFYKNPYLSSFQFELTSRCNERCVHCYIPHEYKTKAINEDLFYKVLKQLKKMGTLSVTLSGGEPMMHKNFKEFLKKAKQNDFYVNVLSNLVLLDDEIIKIMKEGNKVGVQASLYSMIPEHHDYITTVKGSFEKTKQSILKLIDNDIPLQISCPVMKVNKNDVADVIRWGHQHKVRVNVDYAIMAAYDHQTSNLANRLTPEECREVIKDILKVDDEYNNNISGVDFEEEIKSINSDPNERFCGVGINTACMVSNGNVYPCPGWQSYICGNTNKQSLKYIWYESSEIKWLRNLKKKDMPKCLNCKEKAFCSPCLGRFANESKTGNPLEIAKHFCKVAKVNREEVLKWRKNRRFNTIKTD